MHQDNSSVTISLTHATLLNRMTNRIRQSLDLQEVLNCTVQEMRSFLNTDRVKIYRFHADGTGQVIAESIAENRLPSLLNLHFPATDIPPHAREMFTARLRSIVDISQQLLTISNIDNLHPSENLTEEEHQRPVDPCHVEYLTAMGVKSSLAVPILDQEHLWGLLVSHHSQSLEFTAEDLEIVQLVADQVSIAIAQSRLFAEARAKAQREQLINQISTVLHSPLQIQQILQIVLEQAIAAVEGCGGRLYLTPINNDAAQIYIYGTQPQLTSIRNSVLENHPFWQQLICNQSSKNINSIAPINLLLTIINNSEQPTTNIQVITDYQQHLEITDAFHLTSIRSLLVMPLNYGEQCLGCLSIFREQIETDIMWAGKFDPDERNLKVRDSFAAWRELKKNQAREWKPEEITIINCLGTHLSMAIMQHRLYQYEHQQRILVEIRNQELSAARAAAEEASRLKSDFLSSTSHELRTPLASVLNYLKLLQAGFYDNEAELKEYIQSAYQATENLVNIINDVLDIAKIEAGRMQMHPELINLPLMFAQQRDLFSLDSRNQGIPLIIECEVDQVYADKIKLSQVLTNLLANAFKFTDNGEIRLQASLRSHPTSNATQQIVQISVSDTGIGIDPDKNNMLFEPFVQAEGSVKRRYGGTGLGLTICKQLVELMDGKIWLESAGIGHGTSVSFILPNSRM